MIYKSYLIEQKVSQLENKLLLFYGENLGLKNDFKEKLREDNNNLHIKNLSQEDVLKNEDDFFKEVFNISLFDEKKIYFIYEANDKILEVVKELESKVKEQKIYFFSDILDKKSKLRSFFEKSKKAGHGVLIASFLNVGSVVRSLAKDFKNDVLVFCSGWKGRLCIEDTLLAGMIVNKLLDHNFKYESDSAAMSYNIYENNKSNLMSAVEKSAYMNRLNLVNDIRYCMQIDTMSVVPKWKNLKFEDKLDIYRF